MLATRSGRLEKVGQVGGLGRGERIYAVRFIGDRGYVVTFRQTDPLYTLDLADPAHPRVRGELKILGYSAYLHPVGEHELLGIGQDATPEGCARARSSRSSTSPTPPRRSCCTAVALGDLDLLRGGVRPPRVPVVGAEAARRRAVHRRLRRAGGTAVGFRVDRATRASPRPAGRARSARRAHAASPAACSRSPGGAARVRPRHARPGPVHGVPVELTARIAPARVAAGMTLGRLARPADRLRRGLCSPGNVYARVGGNVLREWIRSVAAPAGVD